MTTSILTRQAPVAPGPTDVPPTTNAARPRRVRRVPAWRRDGSVAAFWLVLLLVTALWTSNGGVQDLTHGWAAALTSAGRLTGLVASALLLVQVFLMARVPWVEQAWGQDELARAHRLVGFTSFTLLWVHIGLVLLGYAAGSSRGLWGSTVGVVVDMPGMLLAVAGTVALCLVVVTSVHKARARLRYESWHLLHLYGYLGAGLALPHQLWTGKDFTATPWAATFWWTLYAVCAGSVLLWRLGVPAWRSLRSPIVVTEVRAEGPDATTVTVRGAQLGHLPVQAGQFFQWRLLDGPGWSRAHPFSLSAAPSGDTLRFTAAHLGDGSSRLASLRPGTRVLLEGPYGRLHAGVRTQPKVLLMGAGVGITPLRALLEELPAAPGDLTVIQRSSTSEVLLGEEMRQLAAQRQARYYVVAGHRRLGSSWLPAAAGQEITDSAALLQLVPDVAERDVYLCGAPAWMNAAEAALLVAGVPRRRIHLERFSY